jgi:hypothetical protein
MNDWDRHQYFQGQTDYGGFHFYGTWLASIDSVQFSVAPPEAFTFSLFIGAFVPTSSAYSFDTKWQKASHNHPYGYP